MKYHIRKQDTITPNYGVYWGHALVEGGLSNRSDAWDSLDWFQTHYPTGPHAVREVNGWWLTPEQR